MSTHTKLNLRDDVPSPHAEHGMAEVLDGAHFARKALGMSTGGLSLFRIRPGQRLPFGHTHAEQEETYVVISGAARMKVEDEIVELGRLDAVRVSPGAWRGLESGPDGAEVLAFGAPDTDNADAEMQPGWWS
jgi:mannose-6-phosphate isomerase-like protein (cupin superfamily)